MLHFHMKESKNVPGVRGEKEEGGWDEMEIFPLRSPGNHFKPAPESFVSRKGSKWSILCLAEH